MNLNLSFTSSRWFLLLVAVILPLLLLVVAVLTNAGVCIMMALLVWLGIALMLFYLPRYQE